MNHSKFVTYIVLAAVLALPQVALAGKKDKKATPAAQATTQPAPATVSLAVEAQPVVDATGEAPAAGKVVEVLKGDELVLENGWVVRLIGVDVPTADIGKRSGNFYGKAAIDYVKKAVLNKNVKLVYDQQKSDAYDRLLAYVYSETGEFINKSLAQKGLALAACYPPNIKHCHEFNAEQRNAVQGKLGLWDFNPADWPKSGPANNLIEGVVVRKVIDGDTIQLEDGTILRYIGIDAPESESAWRKGAFGNEAFEVNRGLVEGKAVIIEYDTEFSDPRGRELAYVYINQDGKNVMVNEYLVAKGVAWVAVFPPNVRHIRTLFEAQESAYKNKLGVWK